jgi:DNA primase
MSYVEACKQLEILPKTPPHTQLWKPESSFTPHVANQPELAWRQQASNLITRCHKALLVTPTALELLYERGFTLGTIQDFQLGWNSQILYLAIFPNKKTWFPRGIVIPTFDVQLREPLKLKIRQQDAHPKYIEISGSQKSPGIYGEPTNKPFLILESELDAMLVHQFAGDLCCPIALGGATKRPDKICHELLTATPFVLFALDVDQAGAAAFRWWRNTYPNIVLWPPPAEKSPGDAFKIGIDLRRWVLDGIRCVE